MAGRVQWDDVRFFVMSARLGSLAKAGKALGVEHTTVGRRIEALEAALGTRLLDRTRGGLRMTDAGERVLARAAAAEEKMVEIERLCGTFEPDVAGSVTLATSTVLAQTLVVPALAELRKAHPRVVLHLVVARRLADLPRREADLALRMRPRGAPVAESEVVASKVGEAVFGVYGSPAYLKGKPQLEHDPEQHRVIRYGSSPWEPGNAWLEQRAAAVRAILFADDMPTVREACAAHMGLAILPHFYAAPARLRMVADDVDRAGLYVAVHPDLKRVPRVRAVVSWLGAAVADRVSVATSAPRLGR